ncbi:MAG TPA: anti-sigma regulatory factor [Bacillales bacterium]|nr:anti-sigma regulatory factor [Bacillales bacterium]
MQETQSCIQVRDEKDIVIARKVGREISKKLGFGEVDQVRLTTTVSELARNILLYASGGEICIQPVEEIDRNGLKILARDHGPGIKNIRKVLQDGYTTSGGLGAGLPGVKRLMDEFDIHSEVGVGTEIEVIKWTEKLLSLQSSSEG